jgi:ssDNA-binding replication factor A large subunit
MLEFLGEAARLKERLVSEKGLSEEAIASLVKAKRDEFAGLLSEAAALYAVAKENGVEPETVPPEVSYAKLSELKDGMRGVNVRVAVERVFALKEFERNGRKGSVVNALVSDGSGSAMLVLWDREAQKAHAGGLEKGDRLRIHGAAVKAGLSGPEISLGLAGSLKREDGERVAPSRLSELREGREFDVLARVLDFGGRSEFERNGRKGSVAWFTVGDASGTARLVYWDAPEGVAGRVQPNSVVKVENGLAKQGLGGRMELHVGRGGRLIVGPREAEVAGRAEILGAKLADAAALAEGERSEVKAALSEIVAVEDSKACRACGAEERGVKCSACGSGELRRARRAEAVFESGGARLKAEFRGAQVLRLLRVKSLADDISSPTVVKLKASELAGKEYYLVGMLRGGVFLVESATPA